MRAWITGLVFMVFGLAGTATAQETDPLNTKAEFAYILDADTGLTLYSKRGDEPMVPASMTKIMTAYVVFERIRDGRLSLDDEFTVSENAWRRGGAASGGSTMFLELNSKVRVEDLLRGVIIQSGNDACIVLAEGVSGSEEAFAREMTLRAEELGLSTLNFKNSTGLYHEEHVVSAEDLAQLAYLMITEFPEYYTFYSEREFTWNGIRQPNRNPLLGDVDGADGMKTGHLEISGYGLVGTAVRDGERRIIVLNGLPSIADRAQEARRVMRSAFVDFQVRDIVGADVVVGEADVWLGQSKRVPLKTTEAMTIGVHADAARRMETYISYRGPLTAPVKAGDQVGELVVSAPGMEEIRAPLVADADIPKLGLIGRALLGISGGQ